MTTAAEVKQAFSEAIAESIPAIAAAVWAAKIGGGLTAEDLQQNTRYYTVENLLAAQVGGGDGQKYRFDDVFAALNKRVVDIAAAEATKAV